MSILTWLRKVTNGGATAELLEQPMQFAEEEARFHNLNMKEALDAHAAWNTRLEDVLSGKSVEHLEPAKVASDCECTLGKWIHGTAKSAMGDSVDYEDLKKIHAEFHLNAAEIVKDFLHGQISTADLNLRKLRMQSGMIQLALVRLFSKQK
jgi:hypothetical protein